MQLLMRRPEIEGFISISPPASLYDFSFLAPCPASGLILHGDQDQLVPESEAAKLAQKLSSQRDIIIDYRVVKDANHFFQDKLKEMIAHISDYLDQVLAPKKVAKAS
ncbi:MAG: prolyl oligopeptidase family serine peptidase, partial [Alphaproteobacteria bacterium]